MFLAHGDLVKATGLCRDDLSRPALYFPRAGIPHTSLSCSTNIAYSVTLELRIIVVSRTVIVKGERDRIGEGREEDLIAASC